MTLEELEQSLPWGLHDAYVEQMELDFARSAAALVVRVMMSEPQDLDRRARIDLGGLVFVTMEGPEAAELAAPTEGGGLWVDSLAVAPENVPPEMPRAPAGTWVHQFFVHQWNRSFYVCAREATLTWLEPTAVPARSATRALFPGGTLPER